MLKGIEELPGIIKQLVIAYTKFISVIQYKCKKCQCNKALHNIRDEETTMCSLYCNTCTSWSETQKVGNMMNAEEISTFSPFRTYIGPSEAEIREGR